MLWVAASPCTARHETISRSRESPHTYRCECSSRSDRTQPCKEMAPLCAIKKSQFPNILKAGRTTPVPSLQHLRRYLRPSFCSKHRAIRPHCCVGNRPRLSSRARKCQLSYVHIPQHHRAVDLHSTHQPRISRTYTTSDQKSGARLKNKLAV